MRGRGGSIASELGAGRRGGLEEDNVAVDSISTSSGGVIGRGGIEGEKRSLPTPIKSALVVRQTACVPYCSNSIKSIADCTGSGFRYASVITTALPANNLPLPFFPLPLPPSVFTR